MSRDDQNLGRKLIEKCWLAEVFSSIQGEGPLVGCRQIFIRFYGCHRNCWYCDSPETVTARQEKSYRPANYRIDPPLPDGAPQTDKNPAKLEDLVALVDHIHNAAGPHHSIALTGGEPLIQTPFLQMLLPTLRLRGHRIYLETTGDLPAAFEKISEYISTVAMDIKLPSATKEPARWDQHQQFLHLAYERECDLFVKVITGASTSFQELREAASIVRSCSPDIPLIIQPSTPLEPLDSTSSAIQLLSWQQKLSSIVNDVRVIPQTHGIIGIP